MVIKFFFQIAFLLWLTLFSLIGQKYSVQIYFFYQYNKARKIDKIREQSLLTGEKSSRRCAAKLGFMLNHKIPSQNLTEICLHFFPALSTPHTFAILREERRHENLSQTTEWPRPSHPFSLSLTLSNPYSLPLSFSNPSNSLSLSPSSN